VSFGYSFQRNTGCRLALLYKMIKMNQTDLALEINNAYCE